MICDLGTEEKSSSLVKTVFKKCSTSYRDFIVLFLQHLKSKCFLGGRFCLPLLLLLLFSSL